MSILNFDWAKARAGTQPEAEQSENSVIVVTDIRQYGFESAGQMKAMDPGLATVIKRIYLGLVKDQSMGSANFAEIGAHLRGARERLARLVLSHQAAELEVKEKKQEIKNLRNELARATEVLGTPSDSVAFYIAIALVILLAVYLYLFYVSTGYNAFVFEPSTARMAAGSSLLVAAIFNPRAMQEASQSNPILLFYPVVFIGLGFLIHVFRKQRWIIAAILAFTLVFDAFLAALIVEKIHGARYLLGEVSEPWRAGLLFKNATFYLIIFSGFLVYLMWGLILAFVMAQWDKLGPTHHRQAALQKQIDAQDVLFKGCAAEVARLEGEIVACRNDIKSYLGKLGTFRSMVESMMTGWLHYIAGCWADYPQEVNRRQREANRTRDEMLNQLLGSDLAGADASGT